MPLLDASQVPEGIIRDIRFHDDQVAVKVADLLSDGRDAWSWWRLVSGRLRYLGHSADEQWFGVDDESASPSRIRFDGATQVWDGIAVNELPRPRLWLHRADGAGAAALRAPQLLRELLAEEQAIPAEVEALGLGPEGSVLVYRLDGRRHAVAVSRGRLALAPAPVAADGADAPLLVINTLPEGRVRLMRADDPSRWLDRVEHRGAYIYFDDSGHFYSETEAVEDIASFRVRDEVYTFRQLAARMFRPDLLAQRLGMATETLFPLTEHDRGQLQHAQALAAHKLDLADLKPPRLAPLEAPPLVKGPELKLVLRAEGTGIEPADIALRLLGTGQTGDSPASAPRRETDPDSGLDRLVVERALTLLPGENRTEAEVTDPLGLSHQRRVAVRFEPTEPSPPDLWLAVVATADYDSAGLGHLPLTQNDAAAIATLFEAQSGQSFARVHLGTWCQHDGCGHAPRKTALRDGLPGFLSQAKAGDTFVLYVSGHGVQRDGDYYFLTADSDAAEPDSMISWREVRTWLAGAPPGRRVILLDTCHAGAAQRDDHDRQRLVQQAAEVEGLYVLAATAADERAFELGDLGQGLFTHVLIDGLDGAADFTRDGVVSFWDLARYVPAQVSVLADARGLPMRPFAPLLDEWLDFPLAKRSPRLALHLRVVDLESFSGEAAPERLHGRGWTALPTTPTPSSGSPASAPPPRICWC